MHCGFCLTIEELGALGVAILHLFTFVSSRLHVAVGGSEHGCSRLHQEFTHLDVVTGGGTVEGSPGEEDGAEEERFKRVDRTH